MYMYIHVCIYISVFLISSYGTPMAKRVSYLTLHSFLFRFDGAVNYDFIVINSINSLLIASRCTCIPNGIHTNHWWANLAHTSKFIKNTAASATLYYIYNVHVYLTISFHSKGANSNRVTVNNDHTVLSLACAGGHLNIVQYLLMQGVDSAHVLKVYKCTYSMYMYILSVSTWSCTSTCIMYMYM